MTIKSLTAEVEILIPFQDADPAGVVWHGNYFRYFDRARCALLDVIDYGYRQMADSGYMWPIVDTRVKYIKPLTFDRIARVTAELIEWEYRLKIEYAVFDEGGDCTTKGYTIQVAVDAGTGELCLGSPTALEERIKRYLHGN